MVAGQVQSGSVSSCSAHNRGERFPDMTVTYALTQMVGSSLRLV